MEEYDIIIVGAGPAGLSASIELKKYGHLHVLLIEKNKVGDTDHTWADFTNQINKRNLENSISNKTREVGFGTYLTGFEKRKIDFSTIDQKKLLHLLRSRIGKNITLYEKCSFISFRHKDGLLTVKTNKGDFRCKILIDASSFRSPVTRHYHLQDDIFVWQCMAYEIERESPKELTETVWELPFKSEHEVNFWIDILKRKMCSIGLMYLTKSKDLLSRKKIKKYLDMYMKIKDIKGKIIKTRKGIIAMNDFKPMSFDNILLAGNAGSQAAPDTGYGLIPALDNGSLAASIAAQAVKEGKFDKRHLRIYDKMWSKRYRFNYRFNRILQLIHYYLDFDDLIKYVESFKVSTRWMVKKTRSELSIKDMEWFFRIFSKKLPVFYMIKKLPFSALLRLSKELILLKLSIIRIKISRAFNKK